MNIFYIFLGITVNFFWGLVFLVPYYLKNIDPMLIVLSRFFFYGAVSFLLLIFQQAHWRSLTRLDWQKAMLFAFAGNIGYYLMLVFAIHYAGIALPALIVGALPVTMMCYANFKSKEFPFSKLLLPIFLILVGMVGLKWTQYSDSAITSNGLQTFFGALFALVALIVWTWFGVANADYLKKHVRISGYTWSLAIGICCFLQVIIIFPILFLLNKDSITASLQYPHIFSQLLISGIILGVMVSWLATSWWNKVSQHLPTTLVSQLLVFETISSLLYGYILDRTVPSIMMLVFISISLVGIVMGIRSTRKISQSAQAVVVE